MIFSVNEYNAGALVLARIFPPQFTPCSKYYAIKNILFCGYIDNCGIKLLKIDTVEHLGGMFMKCLPKTTSEYMRKNIIGW